MSVQSNQKQELEKEHTPTPWALRSSGLIVGNLDGNLVFIARLEHADDQGWVDGGFLLRATNNHDAREKLLNTSLDLLMDLCDSRAIERFSAIGVSRIKSHIADLRAALSAAQEQSQI